MRLFFASLFSWIQWLRHSQMVLSLKLLCEVVSLKMNEMVFRSGCEVVIPRALYQLRSMSQS